MGQVKVDALDCWVPGGDNLEGDSIQCHLPHRPAPLGAEIPGYILEGVGSMGFLESTSSFKNGVLELVPAIHVHPIMRQEQESTKGCSAPSSSRTRYLDLGPRLYCISAWAPSPSSALMVQVSIE
ncbi:hypothetical protein Dimus_017101 [Dionaea muscipula]